MTKCCCPMVSDTKGTAGGATGVDGASPARPGDLASGSTSPLALSAAARERCRVMRGDSVRGDAPAVGRGEGGGDGCLRGFSVAAAGLAWPGDEPSAEDSGAAGAEDLRKRSGGDALAEAAGEQ